MTSSRLFSALPLLVLLACEARDAREAPPAIPDTSLQPNAPSKKPAGERLLEVRDVLPGSTKCPAGGKQIVQGKDSDKDGVLDASEITQTDYVCNGLDGKDGKTTLIASRTEPLGLACPTGGKAFSWGFDDDLDGFLDPGEVTGTTFVCNGLRGAAGANGKDGKVALVALTPIGHGAYCTYGGTAIRTGFDLDGDGVLDPGEDTSTSFACNGAPGTSGHSSLVSPSPEPAGTNCKNGGVKIESGLDANDDNVLGAAEVKTTSYVCHGSDGVPGLTTLVNVVAEPAGASCANGGTRIEVGLDANANAMLDASEIAQTRFVCDGQNGAGGGSSPVLTRTTAIAPGATCALGGDQVEAGIDASGNNALETNEVTTTITLCLVRNATPIAPGATCALGGTHYDTGHDRNGDGVLASAEVESTTDVCASLAVTTLGAGSAHTCAGSTNGTLRCWGANTSGQLGDGTFVNRTSPTLVPAFVQPGDLSTARAPRTGLGSSHTCATANTLGGFVKCWGANGDAQLGDGTTIPHALPADVPFLAAEEIAAGANTTCSGGTRCWGDGSLGQIGNGTTNDALSPTSPLTTLAFPSTGVGPFNSRSPGVGDGLACALRSYSFTGTCGIFNLPCIRSVVAPFCWGQAFTSLSSSNIAIGVGGSDASAVSVGGRHGCSLLFDGTVECWGVNTNGELGDGTTAGRNTAAAVPNLVGVVGIAVGASHSCAWLGDGTARCWGANASGQLGDGTTSERHAPAPVQNLTDVVAMAAGQAHTCAALADGSVRCWGANASGQLGDGTTANRLVPTLVPITP